MPHHIYNQITEGFRLRRSVRRFYTVVPTYKILRAVLCLYDLPCPGCENIAFAFAIQCPPYSVFKVQCRTKAAKISAYIYHLSFTVCRCCRFSSASISGGIRSTSRCKLSSSLFSFARSIVSFIFPFSLAFALASSFSFSANRSLIVTLYFSVARRSSPSAGTTFSAWRGLPLFLSGVQRVNAVKGGFNGSCLPGEGNRLFENPGGDMLPACLAGTFPTLQVGIFLHHIGVKIVLPLRQVCPVADNLLSAQAVVLCQRNKGQMQVGRFLVHVYHRRHDIFPSYPANEEICRPLEERLYLFGDFP